jgi:type IV secretion/conjugal transfer VirB4 family ATPase
MNTVHRPQQAVLNTGPFNELLNIFGWIDDTTYLTKTGGLGVTYRLGGVDYEGVNADELARIAHQFMTATRPFDERFHVSQFLVKSRVPPFTVPPCPNAVAAEALQRRADFLNAQRASRQSLYVHDLYMAVEIEGPKPRRVTGRSLAKEKAFLGEGLDRAVQRLHHAAHSFEVALADVICPRRLAKQEAFAFLQRLVNFDPTARDLPLVSDDHLDYYLGNSHVRYGRDHLQVGKQTLQMLTMKGAPNATFAHLLKGLDRIPGEFIACLYWHRQLVGPVRRALWWLEAYFAPKRGASAAKSRAQIEDLLGEIDHDGRTVGDCSLTLLLHDRDPLAVGDAVATAIKEFAAHDAILLEETIGASCAWLAMVPGNHHLNVRAPHLRMTDLNLADLSFIFALDQGAMRNAHLRAGYCAAFQTDSDTPYYFNLHQGDVGHMLILGNTGSGKSYAGGFLLLHSQQYDPFTVVIDVGRGYRKLATALGGSYMELGLTPTVKINPFALPATPEHLHFLHHFVKLLLETGADGRRVDPLTERDDRDLYKQTAAVYAFPAELRCLGLVTLRSDLQRRLAKWTDGGQFPMFDNIEDTFTLDRFQVLDLKAMSDYPQLLQPMLFYVLHRIRERIGHGFAQIWMDECWRTIQHPVIAEYVRDLLKTGRKDNASIILITHALKDFEASGLLADVLMGCHTKLLCADKGFDRPLYADRLQLTETQLDLLTNLTPKKQVYLLRDGHPRVDKVLTLNVDAETGWLLTNDSQLKDQLR